MQLGLSSTLWNPSQFYFLPVRGGFRVWRFLAFYSCPCLLLVPTNEVKVSKMEMKRLCLLGKTAVVLSIVIFGLITGAAAAVSVVRDLPEEPVYQGDEIRVTLSQSGFFMDVGSVTELLPEGFSYRGIDPASGGKDRDYDVATNTLMLDFTGVSNVTYLVEAGTADQIEDAVFSGTWKTLDSSLSTLSGDIQGDTTLTLGTGPKPTPTPTPTPSDGGGNGGGGDGGVVTPTPSATTSPGVTPTPSTTASPGVSPSPSASPGVTPTPSSSPTAGPTTSPSASPTTKPGIPGFELIFAIAGLVAIAQWLRRGGS
jgi:hypothetical protein